MNTNNNAAKQAELKASGEALTECVKRALTAGHSESTINTVVAAALNVDNAMELNNTQMEGGRRRRRHTKKSKKSQRKSKKSQKKNQ